MTIINAAVLEDRAFLATDGEIRGRVYGKLHTLPHIRAAVACRGSSGVADRIYSRARDERTFDDLLAALPAIVEEEHRASIAAGDIVARDGFEAVMVGLSTSLGRMVCRRVFNRSTEPEPPAEGAPFRVVDCARYMPLTLLEASLLNVKTIEDMAALGRTQLPRYRKLLEDHGFAHAMPGFPWVVVEITKAEMRILTVEG